MNQPIAPPATAPGKNSTRWIAHVSKVCFKLPGAASPPSPTASPSLMPNVGASSHTVTNPPNRAKLHHGKASLPFPSPQPSPPRGEGALLFPVLTPRAAPSDNRTPFPLGGEGSVRGCFRLAKIEAARAGVIV